MRTTFKGGGLMYDPVLEAKIGVEPPPQFKAPDYIDNKPYCLPVSDQGESSACAGFATAGYCEVMSWKKTHIPKQVNGFEIYDKAKQLDNDNSDGTTLLTAVQAAKDLGYIDKDLKTMRVTEKKQVQFSLHRYGVMLGGFRITEAWNKVNTKTGYISKKQGNALGGHAVLICYYDDKSVGFQNSWMPWGWFGFGRMTWNQFALTFMGGLVIDA